MAIACAVALLAVPSHASIRLSASPVFAKVGSADVVAIDVGVEGDEVAHDVLLVASSPQDPSGPRTSMRLALPPGAHKKVTILRPRFVRGTTLIEAEEGGAILATAVTRVERLHPSVSLVIVLGTAPAGLRALSRTSSDISLLEIEPATLPVEESLLPRSAVVVWTEPRGTDLSAEQAAMLRRHALRDGHLMLGTASDEPEALRELGLLDLLGPMAKPLSAPLDPTLVVLAGFGRVTLLPGAGLPWSEWSDSAWHQAVVPDRMRLVVSPRIANRAQRRQGYPANPIRHLAGDQKLVTPLLPAALLMLTFFAASVPLELLLRRKAGREGRAPGASPLRHGIVVIVATSACLALAHYAGLHGSELSRIDVVDVDVASGATRAATYVALRRARPGSMALETSEGANLLDVQGLFEWQRDDDVPWLHFIQAAGSNTITQASLDVPFWAGLDATLSWTPALDRIPAIALGADGLWHADGVACEAQRGASGWAFDSDDDDEEPALALMERSVLKRLHRKLQDDEILLVQTVDRWFESGRIAPLLGAWPEHAETLLAIRRDMAGPLFEAEGVEDRGLGVLTAYRFRLPPRVAPAAERTP